MPGPLLCQVAGVQCFTGPVRMDITKRKQLVEELAKQPAPQLVPIERFFDGNDDPGSIGCNLKEHPGMGYFKAVLTTVAQRGDVDAVYAQIAEADPGDWQWPFTDTIFVVGTIDLNQLKTILEPLRPDEVGHGKHFGIPSAIAEKHKGPVLAAWWD
jgi:hypothetical protein